MPSVNQLKYNRYKDDLNHREISDLFHEMDEHDNWLTDPETGDYIYTSEWTTNHDTNSSKNPYMVDYLNDIESAFNNGGYSEFDVISFENYYNNYLLSPNTISYRGEVITENGEKKYIIDCNKIKNPSVSPFNISFKTTTFDGKGLTILNKYINGNGFFVFLGEVGTATIKNINFLNGFLNGTTSYVGMFVLIYYYSGSSGDRTVNFNNVKFNASIYAEHPRVSNYDTYNNKGCTLNCRSCSFYFKAEMQPFLTSINQSNNGLINLYGNSYFYNCNLYFDLHKPFLNSDNWFGNSCYFYNSIIKFKFGGNWAKITSQLVLFRDSLINNCIIDIDAYNDFVKPNRFCIYCKGSNDALVNLREYENLAYQSNIKDIIENYIPMNDNDKFLFPSLIISDNFNKFYPEGEDTNTWYYRTYANNTTYQEDYPTKIQNHINALLTYCNNNNIKVVNKAPPLEIINYSSMTSRYTLNSYYGHYSYIYIQKGYNKDGDQYNFPEMVVANSSKLRDFDFLAKYNFPLKFVIDPNTGKGSYDHPYSLN